MPTIKKRLVTNRALPAILIGSCLLTACNSEDVNNSAPGIPTAKNNIAFDGQSFTTDLTAYDADNDALTYEYVSGPEWLSISGNQLIGTPPSQDIGQHTIEILVSDGKASSTNSFDFYVKDFGPTNVVIINLDGTNRNHLGTYHNVKDGSVTPNIDAFANQGKKFQKAHTVVTETIPSLNSVITGMYPHQSGVEGTQQVWKTSAVLLPDVLKNNNYLVGILGKASEATPSTPYAWDIIGSDIDSQNIETAANVANSLFEKARLADQPFFFTYNVPEPQQSFWALSTAEKDENETEQQAQYSPTDPAYMAIKSALPTGISEIEQDISNYLSSLSRGDALVGEVLATLEQSGFSENTLVILYSNQGWAMPYAQNNVWNQSSNIPLIVRWPGKVPAQQANSTDMISTVDFMPTILSALDIEVPEQVAGQSLLATLLFDKNSDTAEEDEAAIAALGLDTSAVFKTYYEGSAEKRRPMRAIQTAKYNYIFNPWADGTTEMVTNIVDGATFKAMAANGASNSEVQAQVDFYKTRALEEFYLLANDSLEQTNQIDNPEYQQTIVTLEQQLVDWMAKTDDPALSAFLNKDNASFLRMHSNSFLANWMSEQQAQTDAKSAVLGRDKTEAVFFPNHDSYNIHQGEKLTVSAEHGVASNDYLSATATAITTTLLDLPSNGTVTLEENGAFEYTPAEGFMGVDTFTYTANSVSSEESAVALVKITVINNRPMDLTIDNTQGAFGKYFEAKVSATDSDEDALTYAIVAGPSWLSISGSDIVGWPIEDDIGEVNLTLSANDGIEGIEQSFVLTIAEAANNPPTDIAISANTAVENIEFTATVSALDADGESLAYSLANEVLWLTLEGDQLKGTPMTRDIGVHALQISVTDKEQTVTSNLSITVAANQAPTAITISETKAIQGHSFTALVSATDFEEQALEFTLEGDNSWLTLNESELTGTPSASDVGTSNITVSVSDGTSVVKQSFAVTVTENTAPHGISLSNNTTVEGVAFSAQVSAVDTENDSLSYSVSGLPTWLTFDENSLVISGTPENTQADELVGDYPITITVADGINSAVSQSVTITVTAAENSAPTGLTFSPLAAIIDEAYTGTASATDADNDTLTYTFDTQATWLTGSSNTLIGTPATAGDFVVTVTASDGKESISANFTISVTELAPPNTAPFNLMIDNTDAQHGKVFTGTLSATDSDGDAISYSIANQSGNPVWYSIANGNTLTGTPSASDVGANTITIEMSDGINAASSETITINVAANNAPSDLVVDNLNATQDQAFSANLSATDLDGDNVSFIGEGLPAWLTLDGTSLTGTPAEADVGDHTFTLAMTDGIDTTAAQQVTITVAAAGEGQPTVETLFSDDFENGLDKWHRSTTDHVQSTADANTTENGATGVRFKNNWPNMNILTPMDTSGLTNITVSFMYKTDMPDYKDGLIMKYSLDGGTTWEAGTVFKEHSASFVRRDVVLPVAAENQSSLTIRFASGGQYNLQLSYVDDIVITATRP
ncbi:putative Ig domain-containing protein [Thalassotalea sp. PLHSN55]|uniref:putative Ig domain-containing protein n=1 Tax=Thalassotalea sp. PLHSN55 TaxID=3435888 RepID=UPI003F85FEA1